MKMNVNTDTILGGLETEIMSTVWQSNKPVTVHIVTEILKSKRKIAYTTVMTVMSRLTEKGLLKRKTKGRAFVYQATISKETFLTRTTRQILKNFVNTFGDVVVANFTQEIENMSLEKKQKLITKLKKANE